MSIILTSIVPVWTEILADLERDIAMAGFSLAVLATMTRLDELLRSSDAEVRLLAARAPRSGSPRELVRQVEHAASELQVVFQRTLAAAKEKAERIRTVSKMVTAVRDASVPSGNPGRTLAEA